MEDSKILTANEEKALKDAQDTAERLCIRGTIKNRMEGHKWNSLY
ncbi:putative S-adenosylhomocysteine deaminase domain protein [Clostridioides difficile CD51]|nr:hypothetical protein [Clostridioides difficile]EQE77765.1 putative S-adenosylhomocysteine deaminase domain protein [Clostridioides difficile CD51]